jgi:hypothetical protein
VTFLIWRLHRAHAIVAAVVIVAVTALIVPTGIAIANSYHHVVVNCSVSHVGCGDIAFTVFGSNSVFTSLVQDLVMAFPLVLGILWGAPLVPREFEASTEDFAWTQGVTRRRWVLTNLGWALLAAAAWGGALAALFTWWRGPDNAVDGPVKFIYFDVQGVAPDRLHRVRHGAGHRRWSAVPASRAGDHDDARCLPRRAHRDGALLSPAVRRDEERVSSRGHPATLLQPWPGHPRRLEHGDL